METPSLEEPSSSLVDRRIVRVEARPKSTVNGSNQDHEGGPTIWKTIVLRMIPEKLEDKLR